MLYLDFVKKNQIVFASQNSLSQAQDAAKILDNPLFTEISPETMISVRESLVDVGNYFQHLTEQCDLKLPKELLELTDKQKVIFPKPLSIDPEKIAQVLIVDDMLTDLIDTARAFIGWPHLQIEYHHHKSGKDIASDLAKIVAAILEKDPDIILMDQGLGNLNGYDVVRALRQVTDKIIYVTNSDSEDTSRMTDARCLPNCGKGDFPEGLQHALKEFRNRN